MRIGGPAKSFPGFSTRAKGGGGERGRRLAVFRLAPGNCCESLKVAARRGEKLDSDGSGTAGRRTVTPAEIPREPCD